MLVEFRVLGTVEARLDGKLIEVGPPQARCVLVALLADANRVVLADQLVDRVWGDRIPHQARSTLRSYLSRLRQALDAAGGEVEIMRRSSGYVLTADPSTVDLHRFHTLVAQARGTRDDEQALVLFGQALRLWRAEAFAGLDTPWINTLRDTLEAERVAAELDYTDLRLRQGDHGSLVAELANRVAIRPWDERLASQFILTLYRCGRQAEALAHYERVRSRLAEELGADPGPALRELHQQILATDPTLAAPDVAGAVATRSPVPRQLPPAPGMFTGRHEELARLTTALDEATSMGVTVVISAIAGAGGIGKTWLALHWAHRNADRFPDGQLFVDLRGFTPAGLPMPPSAAVRGFLDAFGIEPERIPVELDAQVGLYRSLVADKRMLIVLDNARDTSHVTPLLPGSPSCTVLVTSRDRMPGLVTAHGAHPLPLDMLPEPDARGLLARRLGQTRLDAEPDAITELLTYCAGLPLALGVVAARAATHPNFPLAMLATELRDRATRLDALDQGDPAASLTTVLSWSYHALEPEQAEVFRLLGLTPGQDISLPAAASLTGLPATQTSAVLRMLERVSLVHEHAPERWWMHDLVKLYAADQAHHDQLVDRREGALRRLVDHYTHTAFTGDRLLNPHRPTIVLDPHAPGSHPHPLPDPTTALGWFEAEHSNLLAIQQAMVERGWHRAVWLLAWTLHSFQYRQGHGHDEVTVWRAGVAAAEHLADPATQILARRRLGGACARLGRHDEAVEHLHHALTLAEHTDDLPDQTHTHHALAWAWGWRGENRRALEHAGHALRLSQALDNPEWEADALNTVGWLSARLGEYNQARTHCQAALDLCRRHHYRDGEASTLDSLGYIAFHTGQHADAVRYYQQALTLYRDLDNTYEEAETLDRLGHAYAAEGQHGQAHHAWQQALELYHAQHRSEEAARIQQQLNTLRVPNKVVRRAAR